MVGTGGCDSNPSGVDLTLLAYIIDETPCPMVVGQIPHMGVTGQDVLIDYAIVFAVYAGAAHYLIGILEVGCEIFQARIVKLVRANFVRAGVDMWPRIVRGFA